MTFSKHLHNREEGIYFVYLAIGGDFLLKSSSSHLEFQEFVKEQLQIRYLKHGFLDDVLLNHKILASVWLDDLSSC